MRSLLVLALAAPWLAAQSLGDMSDLSAAYNKARSFAHSYRGTAPTWSEPSWNAATDRGFLPEPVKTAEQIALEQRAEVVKKRIAKLTASREHWRVALERIQSNQDWRKDLKYWAEESQAAQIGALMASVKLLVGASGPLEAAVETHTWNSVEIWKKLEPCHAKLRQAENVMAKIQKSGGRLSPSCRKVLEELKRQHAFLLAGMKNEMKFKDYCRNLRTFADITMNAVTALELADDLVVKQDLALAINLIKDTAIEALMEVGLLKLKKMGYQQYAVGGRLLTFGVEYCYQGARFFDAWWNVDRILAQEENQRLTSDRIGKTIVQITDKVTELKADLSKLEAAKQASMESQKQALENQRSKEYYQATLMGDWFAKEAGIRIPEAPPR